MTINRAPSPCHWQVVTELENRGVQDIFIACVDGLKGFPEAIEAVYPHAAVQLCIVLPFFDYPPEIRKVIYTTNTIESVNMSLRKITRNRGSFPSDEALLKLFYLALRNISKKWTMPIRDWKAALSRFTIEFEERMKQR